MRKLAACVVLLCAVMIAVPTAFSQTLGSQPVIYTYVSQFQVPRANWATFAEGEEKSFVPIVDRMVADGTILSYTTFETVVHSPEGYTHGAAWTSRSVAGLMKVLDELRKAGPQPGQVAATKHEDFFMQSTMYLPGSGTPAYLRVVCQNAKPDKPEEYTAAMKKYIWPLAEDQLKKGNASYVGVDSQYVNNTTPSTRCLVIQYPNADSIDKWATAVNANFNSMSPTDRDTFFGSTVSDSRRDIMARITHSGQK